ncbi:MAG: tetratricopeptide repeat protein, partial [Saprospiraceae bacterium]|nr:tetratricopeptide repeat protein [Saprospiraceae bacterium]
MADSVFGRLSREYATCLFNKGRTYYFMNKYADAMPLYVEARDIQEKVLGTNNPDYAWTLNNIAAIYWSEGRYELAEPLFLKAKDIRLNTLGENHPDYAASVNNLAAQYYSVGRYESAGPLYFEAKAIQEKSLGKENIEYAKFLNNLAVLYMDMGHYETAEMFYLEAKAIGEKLFGKEDPFYAICLNNLGNLYWIMGHYGSAEINYLEAQSIQEKKLGKKHLEYIKNLNNLAVFYMENGRYEVAEPLYLEVLSAIGKGDADYAACVNNLATLYFEMGRYDASEPLFQEAKDAQAKIVGKNHPNYSRSIHNLGSLYHKQGKYELANNMFLEAKAIFEAISEKEHPYYVINLSSLAALYGQTGHPDKAIPLFIEANNLQRDRLLKSSRYLSEKELSKYALIFVKDIDNYFSFVQSQTSSGSQVIGIGYNIALFHKGFLLEAVNRRNNLLQSDTTATRLSNLQKSYLRRLSREYAKPVAKRDTVHIAEWQDKANTFEKELVRSVAGLDDLVKQVYWQEVQQKLPADAAAIEFIHYRYYNSGPTDSTLYAALVLLPSDTAPYFIPLFEERQLKAHLHRPGLSEKLVLKELYGNSPEFRHLIWDPLEPLLRDVKTIYYSPSGLLHRLNPAALLDESNQTLSEGRQWVRVGSTRELVTGYLANQSFAHTPKGLIADPPLSAIVYGGITYDMDSLAYAAANPFERMDSTGYDQPKDGNFRYIQTDHSGINMRSSNPDGSWDPLSSTGREADEVSALLGAAGFRIMVQKEFFASEERIKQIGVH